jgi:hypothetical protein
LGTLYRAGKQALHRAQCAVFFQGRFLDPPEQPTGDSLTSKSARAAAWAAAHRGKRTPQRERGERLPALGRNDNNQTIPNDKSEPEIERDNLTFNIPANIKRNKKGHLCITLEKAGIYRGKQRYTVNEIPDLGATVSPEVEVARWLLLRGADPWDQMDVRYPKGQGVSLELEFQGKPDTVLINPHDTTLADAAHLFRTNEWFSLIPLTRFVSGAEFEANLDKPLEECRPDLATKWDDKIGAETRRRLKAEAGILIEDYLDKWRNELAAHLQEEAAKWKDGSELLATGLHLERHEASGQTGLWCRNGRKALVGGGPGFAGT